MSSGLHCCTRILECARTMSSPGQTRRGAEASGWASALCNPLAEWSIQAPLGTFDLTKPQILQNSMGGGGCLTLSTLAVLKAPYNHHSDFGSGSIGMTTCSSGKAEEKSFRSLQRHSHVAAHRILTGAIYLPLGYVSASAKKKLVLEQIQSLVGETYESQSDRVYFQGTRMQRGRRREPAHSHSTPFSWSLLSFAMPWGVSVLRTDFSDSESPRPRDSTKTWRCCSIYFDYLRVKNESGGGTVKEGESNKRKGK